MTTPRYIAIANPGSKRWQKYEPDLRAFWADRGVTPGLTLVPWADIVPHDGSLDGLSAFDTPAIVRLESPGRDFEVTKQLLEAGSRSCRDRAGDWLSLEYRKGRQVAPGLLYAGFRRVLMGLRESFDARPHLDVQACPLAVAELFDKNATTRRLAAADLPCPPTLDAPSSTDDLLDQLRDNRYALAYVKLNTGSSASAIAVVHALDPEPWADSTLVRLDGAYHSSRRLKRYAGSELSHLLQWLLDEGANIQRGIRMAQMDGQNFDVRVVVIHGQPAFTIFRLSSLPMTNLHLGGRRGDPKRCRDEIPKRAWLDAIDDCVSAASLYDSAIVGVDLLFESGYLRHYILEMNAFGDFFPDLTDEQGRTVHRYEIEETARRCGYLE